MPLASHTVCFLSLLLLAEVWKTVGYSHSLCLNLTVKSQSRPGQPWGEAQGSVDEKPFLHYDGDSNEVTPLGPLGEQVNATKAWTDLTQSLREVVQELRIILPDIKLEENTTRGPPALQAKLSCEREAQRGTGASWEFSINGHRALLFDAMSGKWSAINPGARGIKEECKNNPRLAKYFRKTSKGDCNHWLMELLEHWGEMLEPTGLLVIVPPQNTPEIYQSNSIMFLIFILLPSIIIITVVIAVVIRKRGDQAPLETMNVNVQPLMMKNEL